MELLPKISIITPSFNQGNYLKQTIESVLDQHYPRLEYIIIDGDSNDNSVQIIESFNNQLAYWVSEPDSGQAEAINKGLSKATGEIVAWINSDDLLKPNILYKVAEKYLESPCQSDFWLICAIEKSDEIHPEYSEFYPQHQIDNIDSFLSNPERINQQGCFWSRQITDRLGYLDQNFHLGLDTEYFLRFLANDYKMIVDNSIIAAVFRIHHESKTANFHGEIISTDQAFKYDWTQIYLKYLTPSNTKYKELKREFLSALTYFEIRFSQSKHISRPKRIKWLIKAALHTPRIIFSRIFFGGFFRIVFY